MSAPSTPPPVPTPSVPTPPPRAVNYATPDATDPTSTYQVVADKVGFVPSLRGSDNLISLIGLVVGVGSGSAVGLLSGEVTNAVVLAIAGGFGGVLVAGVYLGVRNLFRRV